MSDVTKTQRSALLSLLSFLGAWMIAGVVAWATMASLVMLAIGEHGTYNHGGGYSADRDSLPALGDWIFTGLFDMAILGVALVTGVALRRGLPQDSRERKASFVKIGLSLLAAESGALAVWSHVLDSPIATPAGPLVWLLLPDVRFSSAFVLLMAALLASFVRARAASWLMNGACWLAWAIACVGLCGDRLRWSAALVLLPMLLLFQVRAASRPVFLQPTT